MKQTQTYANEKGFTLVELLASIVILSVIFVGVFQLFTFTTKTATMNNTKLVTSHLAKATIERIKVDYESFFLPENFKPENTKDNCESIGNVNCDNYQFKVNDSLYNVTVKVSQSDTDEEVEVNGVMKSVNEKALNLINVVVTVNRADTKINSTVEGYVIYDGSSEE